MPPRIIGTKEGFLAALKLPHGARLGLFEFHDGELGVRYVMAGIDGETELLALLGARAVLNVIKGCRASIRVAPEANSQVDFMDGKRRNIGYVRFAFYDEPGEWVDSAMMKTSDGQMRYCGLAEMSKAKA